MEQPEKYSWVDEFLDSAERTLGFMDLSTIRPLSWRHFQPLIAEAWLEWIWNIKEERERQGLSFEDIAAALPSSRYRDQFLFTTEDLKSARWPLGKRLAVADFFHDLLRAQLPQGDLFGFSGTTRVRSPSEVRDIMKKDFMPGTPEIARELGKIYNAAYNLSAALYFDFYMTAGLENFGPYPLSADSILVEKEMYSLSPREIWPDLDSHCRSISLKAVYENVGFSTTLFSDHSRYSGDVIRDLRSWRLIVDDVVVSDVAGMRHILDNLAQLAKAQWLRVQTLSEQELVEKATWARCYFFKTLCGQLSLDWRPTRALLEAPRGKTLADGWRTWHQPADEGAFRAYWRDIWDPRKDRYP